MNEWISCKEMAEFLWNLRDRQEIPINEDEYYLLGEIADRLIGISEQEES